MDQCHLVIDSGTRLVDQYHWVIEFGFEVRRVLVRMADWLVELSVPVRLTSTADFPCDPQVSTAVLPCGLHNNH